MKERPIIFSMEMVKAILDGRKTMTRRVIKPQPEPHLPNKLKGDLVCHIFDGSTFYLNDGSSRRILSTYCPHGQIGDRLWVRETWYQDTSGGLVCYKADYPLGDKDWPPANTAGKIKPSIFMPRWASRLTLEITEIRVERLQEITEEDAIKEGLLPAVKEWAGDSAKWQFSNLWDSLNAKRGYGWDKNQWVWVIKFDNIGVRVK